MAGVGSILPLIVIAASIVSAGFLRYLWPYRNEPGGWFFIGTIAAETLWTLAYGVALFIFDPALRLWFELPIWIGTNFIGVFFLAFALEYTGRGEIVRSPVMAVIVSLQLVHTGIVATNPFHHIAWSTYQISPLFGAATVTYTHTHWLSINFIGIYLMVAAGAFLLFDAFFSYGKLYRDQAAAIALSPVLPGIAFFFWVIEVGITPPLNLTPLTFPVHLCFIFYAFFRRNMFELTPAARRASERTAIEDLGTPVIVVDDVERIINLNAEAERIFGVEDSSVLGESLQSIDSKFDALGDGGTLSIETDGERLEYAISTASLHDSADRIIGRTIVMQDITTEKQRELRLGVLNRVLRHNLRNDLNVVQGYIERVRESMDDEELAELLEIAEDKTDDVINLGEKARQTEEAISTKATPTSISLYSRLDAIAAELNETFPRATIRIDVPHELTILGTERLVDTVFQNLIENALEHNQSDDTWVEVMACKRDNKEETVTIEVRDNGPGIPDHELSVLDAEEETPLEHGSGLGLWLVTWGIRSLGGALSISTSEEGTTVTLELPTANPP